MLTMPLLTRFLHGTDRRFVRRPAWECVMAATFFPIHAPALPSWAELLAALLAHSRDRLENLLGTPGSDTGVGPAITLGPDEVCTEVHAFAWVVCANCAVRMGSTGTLFTSKEQEVLGRLQLLRRVTLLLACSPVDAHHQTVLPALEQRIFELFRLAQPAVFPEVKSSRLWDTELGPSP